MTVTDAKAYFGVLASATPTGTNVSNNLSIGESLTTRSYSSADLVYSFKMAAAGAGNVLTWTVDTSATSTTGGTITDGDGKDFEGVTMPTGSELKAVMINVLTLDATSITIAGTLGFAAPLLVAGDVFLWAGGASSALDPGGTITVTFGAGDGVVECTAIMAE